jgi:hypothetical protein
MHRYWIVTDAATAKVVRHEDIGDIREITNQGHILNVTPLPGNRVEVQMKRETYIVSPAFVTREEAEKHADKVLTKEIERLQVKRDKLTDI